MINSQLDWIIKLLEDNNIKYWVDGGTLLGLKREKKILTNDNDIDISMWAEEEILIKKLLPVIKGVGYKIFIRSYFGLNFKYKFISKREKLMIDINIFRKYSDYAWCPQPHGIINRHNTQRIIPLIYKAVNLVRRKLLKIYPWKVIYSNFPWNLINHMGCWWIPYKYYKNIENDKELAINIPHEWNEYLTYRYGNWRVPCNKWVFWTDDHSLRHDFPKKLLEKSC